MAEQSPFGNKDKGRTDSFSLARKASPLSPLIDTRTPRPPSRSTTANPPWVNGWRSSSTLSSRRRLDGTKVGIWRAGSVAEVPGTDVTPSSHGGDHDHLAAIVVVVLVEQELVVGDGDGRRRAARRRVGDRSRPTTWMRSWTITSTSDRTGTVKRWQTQVQRGAMLVVRMACKLTEGRVQKVFFLTIGRASKSVHSFIEIWGLVPYAPQGHGSTRGGGPCPCGPCSLRARLVRVVAEIPSIGIAPPPAKTRPNAASNTPAGCLHTSYVQRPHPLADPSAASRSIDTCWDAPFKWGDRPPIKTWSIRLKARSCSRRSERKIKDTRCQYDDDPE